MSEKVTNGDLLYEINILLQGVLYYAGVSKENFAKSKRYLCENISEILERSNATGVDKDNRSYLMAKISP